MLSLICLWAKSVLEVDHAPNIVSISWEEKPLLLRSSNRNVFAIPIAVESDKINWQSRDVDFLSHELAQLSSIPDAGASLIGSSLSATSS